MSNCITSLIAICYRRSPELWYGLRISPATTIHWSTKPFLVPGCGSSCYCPAAGARQASITQLISIKRHCKCLYQQGLRLKTMYTLGHSLSVYITVVWTQYRHHIKSFDLVLLSMCTQEPQQQLW